MSKRRYPEDKDELKREFKKPRHYHTFSKEYTELWRCLKSSKEGEHFAHCTVCSCDFSIKYGGLDDCLHHVEKHARSKFATLDKKVIPAPALGKYEEVYSQESCDVATDLPTLWAPMERGTPVMVFEVVPDTEEYRALACKFYETCPFGDYDIARVIRVQNPILWKHFVLKQSEMIQENDGIDVVVKQLYHGTHHSTLEAIARKGFDWRLSGKNGSHYGNGSYFARTAQYSHDYTDRAGSGVSVKTSGRSSYVLQSGTSSLSHYPYNPPRHSSLWGIKGKKADIQIKPDPHHTPNCSGTTTVLQCRGKGTANLSLAFARDRNSKTHFMFVAKVLVGRHSVGKSGLNRPPPLDDRNPYGKCFDSCVNNISSPKVYVIFDSNQAYPEYIIEYNWHKR